MNPLKILLEIICDSARRFAGCAVDRFNGKPPLGNRLSLLLRSGNDTVEAQAGCFNYYRMVDYQVGIPGHGEFPGADCESWQPGGVTGAAGDLSWGLFRR